MVAIKNTEFSSNDALAQAFDENIRKVIKKKNDIFFKKDVFDPSYITECPRKLIFRALHIDEDIDDKILSIKLNIESNLQKWLDLLDKCSKIRVLDNDVLVADGRLNLTSHLDFIISYKGAECEDLLGVKIVPFVFNSDDVSPLRKHIVDLMTCVWMADLKQGILVYDNIVSGEFKTFHVKVHDPIINAVKSKCEKLVCHQILGTLPQRPYKSAQEIECRKCGFSKVYWQTKI